MSMGWESQIIRVSTGKLNTVNDTVIANQSGITGVSKFGGQLGKVVYLAQDQISTMFDSSVGTLFGGAMPLRASLGGSFSTPEPAVGQMLFWDDNPLDPGSYIVTDTPPTDVPNPAGVYIGGIEAGTTGSSRSRASAICSSDRSATLARWGRASWLRHPDWQTTPRRPTRSMSGGWPALRFRCMTSWVS